MTMLFIWDKVFNHFQNVMSSFVKWVVDSTLCFFYLFFFWKEQKEGHCLYLYENIVFRKIFFEDFSIFFKVCDEFISV